MAMRTLMAAGLLMAAGTAMAQAPATPAAPAGSAAPVAAKPLSPASIPTPVKVAPAEQAALFTTITAGGLPVTLERTTLADVAAAFGGTVSEGGTGAARVSWLCYAGTVPAGASVFWFVSSAAAEGGAQPVTTVAVEPQGAGGPGTCPPAPEALTGIDAGIPGPGTPLADLRKALGVATPGPVGHVHYAVVFPAEAAGARTQQTVVYTGARGKVTGLALSAATVH